MNPAFVSSTIPPSRKVASFAFFVACTVAANAVGTEKRRSAILNHVALLAFAAIGAAIAAAIDIRFVTVLDVVVALVTGMRFEIAINARGPAVGIRVAFDAIPFAVARLPSVRVARRSLRYRCALGRSIRTGGVVTIDEGGVVRIIDGFFTA